MSGAVHPVSAGPWSAERERWHRALSARPGPGARWGEGKHPSFAVSQALPNATGRLSSTPSACRPLLIGVGVRPVELRDQFRLPGVDFALVERGTGDDRPVDRVGPVVDSVGPDVRVEVGRREVLADASTEGWARVPDLDALPGRWVDNPEGERTRPYARMLVDGRFNELLDGFDTELEDGARVALVNPFVYCC